MKIEIIPSKSNSPRRDGWIRLTEKDFNHYESFFAKHPDIQPESVEEIYTKGVLELIRYPNILIRHIDWMLKKDGKFIVDYCFPKTPFWGYFNKWMAVKYFIARSFSDDIILTKINVAQYAHAEYLKQRSCLPDGDNIDSWTWGICSNGAKNENVMALINQINNFNIPNCEIIVCGPRPAESLPHNVIVLDDSSIYTEGDIRFPIGKKKNLIAKSATYNNLIILHDRFSFPASWYDKMKEYGNYFDMLAFPVLDVNNPSLHTYDWQNADEFNPLNPVNLNHVPAYSIINEYVYINGGIFVCKKHIYQELQIPYKLNWDEMEDIAFSRRLMQNGNTLSIDTNNNVFSTTHRMSTVGEPSLYPVKKTLRQRIMQKREFYFMIHKTKKEYNLYINSNVFSFDLFELKWVIYRCLNFLCNNTFYAKSSNLIKSVVK